MAAPLVAAEDEEYGYASENSASSYSIGSIATLLLAYFYI